VRREAEIPKEWRKSKRPPATMTATELMDLELPPAKWAVPGVLPEGVTILAGKPKMGKSWLALGTCIAVASGGAALGKIRVEQGGVLYLALEDNNRRLQKRLRKVLDGRDAPEGMELCTEWPQLDQGGIETLRQYAAEHSELRLIVIDTLKKIRPRESGSRGVYDLDYEALEPLLPLAAEFGVAILVVHHLRKMEAGDPLDMVSGSTGLTGGVDGAIVLKRDRGKQDATLVIDGRDIEEPTELALRWEADIASWTLMGDAEEYRMSEERREIVNLLRRVGEPLGPKDIAQMLGRNYGAVRVMLSEMVKDGLIVSLTRGKYATPNITNNSNITDTANIANNIQGEVYVSDVSAVNNNQGAKGPIDKPNHLDVSDVSCAEGDRRLTAEEVERVKRLIEQGWSASAARAEVLKESV
jgi:AAA domain-containing protein